MNFRKTQLCLVLPKRLGAHYLISVVSLAALLMERKTPFCNLWDIAMSSLGSEWPYSTALDQSGVKENTK